MKNSKINWSYFYPILVLSFLLSSCSKNDTSVPIANNNANVNISNLQSQINALPVETLNATELASLVYMREEEKLARDVYKAMYTKWGINIFTNISASEQTHMDAILLLLNKYNLIDPVGSKPEGIFGDANLQNLYGQLISLGNSSLQNAYIVGATIEDLDIFDLQNALLGNDNQDVKLVYDMLTKGSRNHMRSFYKNLVNIGGNYTPQYISLDEFTSIVNTSMETGF